MTIINVCNLFAPIVGPLIGIINILIFILIGDIKNGHGNLNFLNGFFFIIFFMFNAW